MTILTKIYNRNNYISLLANSLVIEGIMKQLSYSVALEGYNERRAVKPIPRL